MGEIAFGQRGQSGEGHEHSQYEQTSAECFRIGLAECLPDQPRAHCTRGEHQDLVAGRRRDRGRQKNPMPGGEQREQRPQAPDGGDIASGRRPGFLAHRTASSASIS